MCAWGGRGTADPGEQDAAAGSLENSACVGIGVRASVLVCALSTLCLTQRGLRKTSELIIFIVPSQVPSIQTDDSALQNIDLQDRLMTLEAENKDLRATIRTLETRVTELSRGAAAGVVRAQDSNMAELIEQMKELEEECAGLRKKVRVCECGVRVNEVGVRV